MTDPIGLGGWSFDRKFEKYTSERFSFPDFYGPIKLTDASPSLKLSKIPESCLEEKDIVQVRISKMY